VSRRASTTSCHPSGRSRRAGRHESALPPPGPRNPKTLLERRVRRHRTQGWPPPIGRGRPDETPRHESTFRPFFHGPASISDRAGCRSRRSGRNRFADSGIEKPARPPQRPMRPALVSSRLVAAIKPSAPAQRRVVCAPDAAIRLEEGSRWLTGRGLTLERRYSTTRCGGALKRPLSLERAHARPGPPARCAHGARARMKRANSRTQAWHVVCGSGCNGKADQRGQPLVPQN
jgi:hypothetical protein